MRRAAALVTVMLVAAGVYFGVRAVRGGLEAGKSSSAAMFSSRTRNALKLTPAAPLAVPVQKKLPDLSFQVKLSAVSHTEVVKAEEYKEASRADGSHEEVSGGVVRMRESYSNGKREGETSIYNSSGKLKETTLYAAGLPVRSRTFDPNTGVVLIETSYDEEGRPAQSTYFDKGATVRLTSYKQGMLDNDQYFVNGELSRKTVYGRDYLVDEEYRDGRLVSSSRGNGQYRQGETVLYGEDGNPSRKELYSYGTLISVTERGPDGKDRTVQITNPASVRNPDTSAPVVMAPPPADLKKRSPIIINK